MCWVGDVADFVLVVYVVTATILAVVHVKLCVGGDEKEEARRREVGWRG